MKKIIALFLILITFSTLFIGCQKQQTLDGYVSQLRSDIFEGSSQNVSLKCTYGFKEQPYKNDGIKGQTVSLLTFKLLNKETDDVTYTLSMELNGEILKGTFSLNPVSDSVTCELPTEDFNIKEFTVKVSFAGNTENIVMRSIIPENTITYSKALLTLAKSQSVLISHYMSEEGVFLAEIHARILVKDGKAYWYVGIVDKNADTKALLIDGTSGEVLAIREIF